MASFGNRPRQLGFVAERQRHVARGFHQRRRVGHHPMQIEDAASRRELVELLAHERIVGIFDERQEWRRSAR